ncbi:c-type cytochrome [Desulfuromonas versatilis]|uniref:C-type cytochrome n=1 Tax=Desulfuromonas versatilis TaxID=2802975 RepID=A0ABM8HVK6_9BACT|nr:c-type cytochrome [Desulfuromonas versatilis]
MIGAMMVTVITPFLLGAIFYDLIWHIGNTYVAAIIYMVLGPAFIGGLVLVFLGLFFFKGREEVRLFTLEYLRDYFNDPSKFSKMRKLVFFAVFLSCINLFVMGLLAYRGYHYMESVGFCGQFCHTVMNPEHTAYSNSPHSRVACVECHIGAGATWFVKSKISGARQLFAVALDTYPRPIQVPVHGLRPARETCEECHRPEKFHGEKLVVRDKFREDEANTHVQTVLLMKIGSAGDRAKSSHGIHWHVAPENRITYKASDHSRMVIPEVTLHKQDGTQVVFRSDDADDLLAEAGEHGEVREMDCIDCHNRPTHIYLPADVAVDNKILSGEIAQELPFIKKMAMEVVTREYASQEEAKSAIATDLNNYYQKNYPDLVQQKQAVLERSIAAVQAAYAENVFPEMNIKWGTYTNHIGHMEDGGCFRCHDESHESPGGEVVSQDCDTCHTILAEEEENPEVLDLLRGQ